MAVRIQDSTVLEIKNAVVVVVLIFFKRDGMCVRLAGSDYFTQKSQ